MKNKWDEINKVENLDIVVFCDNNSRLWGHYIAGIQVVSPKDLLTLRFDIIIITSIYSLEIKKQLLNMGIEKDKVIFWGDYYSELVSGNLLIYHSKTIQNEGNKNALIISTKLNYNGGSLAAIYAGQALQQKGYNVILAAPDGNIKFIQEWIKAGITIAICPAIPYIKDKEIEWVLQFDIVLVNILGMMPCAEIISKFKPVVWWIHESVGNYQLMLEKYRDSLTSNQLSRIQICAVSTIPQKLFNFYIENGVDAILHYGIPDKRELQKYSKTTRKIVFAIIGGVCVIKGHDIFIEAVKKIDTKKKANAEFWIIGKNDFNEFSQDIVVQGLEDSAIRIFGEKTREEIELLYSDIDVVVSASRIDSLPIIMTEGMMYGKVCIASDTTGTVDYIKHGLNGFIVEHENSDDLCEKMEWIIDNREKLDEIEKRSRKTYEDYFTMEQFGTELEKMFEEAKAKQKKYEKSFNVTNRGEN